MKIVFTVATYWPKQDGVQMVTSYHAETLAAFGHEVVVITSKVPDTPDQEKHNGVNIVRVDAYNHLYWHKGDKPGYEKVVLEETENADALVAVCLQSFAADWVLDILKDIKCRKILYMHGMPDFKLHKSDFVSFYNVFKTLFRNLRWRWFYTTQWKYILQFDTAVHLFENDNSHRYFRNHGFNDNYIIENSCSNTFFDNKGAECTISKNFLCVGNYCQRKNQLLALRAFYQTSCKDFILTFVGSCQNAYYYKLKAEKEKLDKQYGFKAVNLLTGLSRAEITKLTKDAYCCLMSSTFEFYPIVAIEAMAAGVPFVSTDVGVLRLLPGVVIVRNMEDMTYWMDKLAGDIQLRNNIGVVGREYAKTHLYLENKVRMLESLCK